VILTEKMEYLSAIVLIKDIDTVTKTLLAMGVVEFSIDKQYAGQTGTRAYSNSAEQTKIQELRKRCGSFLAIGGLALPDASAVDVSIAMPALDVKQVEKFINDLSIKTTNLRDKQRQLQQKGNALRIMQRRLSSTDAQSDQQPLLAYEGTIPTVYGSGLQKKLQNFGMVTIQNNHLDRLKFQFLFHQTDEKEILKVLGRYRLEDINLLSLAANAKKDLFLPTLENSIKEIEAEQAGVEQEVVSLIKMSASSLSDYWLALRTNELYSQIQGQFRSTNTTAIFSGWIASSDRKKVVDRLEQITQGRILIQSESVDSGSKSERKEPLDPPTKLRNNPVSSPYELLVNTYGVVKYGHVDPTFVVSIFFTLMFGLMFADAGQGLVILALGIFLLIKSKKAADAKTLRDAGKIVLYCGTSAVFFGVMFGSYFGLQLLPPIWFDMHGIAMTGQAHHTTASAINSVPGIFAMSFKFGFVILGTGLLFNFINKMRTKQYFSLIFSANGILGALFYVSSAHMIWHYVANGSLNSYAYTNIVLAVLLAVVVLFGVVPIVHTLEHNKAHKQKLKLTQVLSWPAIWAFELFEMATGYFSSTLSFVRVGAIGIVHAVLMGVFYSMAASAGNILLSIAIVLFVNVLVIGLEGLLAAVNSMRLHYYEFFSRYFEAGGRLFKPVSLR
jgi:V/A-type H+/Na+-transporting ATPase subunit I